MERGIESIRLLANNASGRSRRRHSLTTFDIEGEDNVIREDVVAKLVATGKWSDGTARLAERAGYNCEYCGFDLLASVEAYKLFEVDHIVPLSRAGDPVAFDNLALSCRHCNFHLKRS